MDRKPQLENQSITPPSQNFPQARSYYSTMATLSLILGILGLLGLGPITGIPALIIGKMELDKIKRNQSPAYNRSLANVGLVLGIIATALFILFLLAVAFVLAVFGSLYLNR